MFSCFDHLILLVPEFLLSSRICLPPFSLIRDFRKENTRGNVFKISVNHACYRGQKLTEILETFPRVFCFRKSRINENGGNAIFRIFLPCHCQMLVLHRWSRDVRAALGSCVPLKILFGFVILRFSFSLVFSFLPMGTK